MDPLAALGVAAAVAQFVQFAASLISTSNEIFHSAKGTTADNLEIEEVYQKLHNLSKKLEATPLQPSSEHEVALRKLSANCRLDCAELLEVLEKLRVDGGKNRLWRSIKTSLKTAWDGRKISALEKRLERTHRAMSIHVGYLVSDQVSDLSNRLRSIKEENERLHLDHSSKVDAISKGLKELQIELKSTFNQGNANNGAEVPPQAFSDDLLEKVHLRLNVLLSMESDVSKEQAILFSLNFHFRPVRHTNIPEAYVSTFSWIFKSNFSGWLEEGSGIFWVSGKAGSGKSTLMKFIAGNPKTSDLLVNGGPKGVAMAAHYFWSAGTSMQKSQQGLLQTLLYDIFRRCPEYTVVACPRRWVEAERDIVRARTETWTNPELFEALNNLAKERNLPVKFCFLIDGLDEFDGDHHDLCELLADLSRSPNIKLCVSSRPWNVFEDAFGHGPKLNIHDLTQNDILHYAQSRLESHQRWRTCAVGEDQKKALITDIRDRAEGVFLWAFLVTRSLRDGLTNDDTIHDLRKRLDSLPTDLEQLFKHILESVDPVYHDQMARTMLIALHTHKPLALDIYAYHDNEYEDEDYALYWPVRVVQVEETKQHCSRTRRRIDARSRGLLETRDERVEFLHRTVCDFLHTREMTDYLSGKLKSKFDAFLSITRAYVALIKSTEFVSGTVSSYGKNISRAVFRDHAANTGGWLISLLRETLKYASGAEESSIMQMTDLLDELERCLEEIFETGQAVFYIGKCNPRLLVREEVLRSELCAYVARKLASSDYLALFEDPPLFAAVQPSFFSRSILSSVDMLHLLLDRGENPNEVDHTMGGSTPWSTFACRASPWSSLQHGQDAFQVTVDKKLFSKFLAFGANPNAREPWSHITVFAMYLLSSFSSFLREAPADTYLRTLDDFLEAGADLDANLKVTGFSTTSWEITSIRWWPENEAASTISSAFCQGLRNLGRGRVPKKMSVQKRRRLLSLVTNKLISKGILSEAKGNFKPAIEKAFPPDMAMPMLNLLQNRVSGGESRKRRVEEAGEPV